jgi:hypothetical protein
LFEKKQGPHAINDHQLLVRVEAVALNVRQIIPEHRLTHNKKQLTCLAL